MLFGDPSCKNSLALIVGSCDGASMNILESSGRNGVSVCDGGPVGSNVLANVAVGMQVASSGIQNPANIICVR